jgi:hypothetical protein
MNKVVSLVMGAVVVATIGSSAATAEPIDACVPLPAKVGSQEVLGQKIPGVSDLKVCVTSRTAATGEPQLRRYEGCGDPCFAIVVRNLRADIDTTVTISYSLDGKPQDPLPVTTGQTSLSPLDGIHNCVYAYHEPGSPSPCENGISNPANLRATAGKAKVSLAWNRSFAFGESEVAGYEIWRSDSGADGTFTLLTTATATSFVDTAVVRGATYYYSVLAFDNEGTRSGASNIASATVN